MLGNPMPGGGFRRGAPLSNQYLERVRSLLGGPHHGEHRPPRSPAQAVYGTPADITHPFRAPGHQRTPEGLTVEMIHQAMLKALLNGDIGPHHYQAVIAHLRDLIGQHPANNPTYDVGGNMVTAPPPPPPAPPQFYNPQYDVGGNLVG